MYACFVGYIVQAIINNFVPLLFLTFEKNYHIPLSQITMLITFNFGVQLVVDFFAAKYVDRIIVMNKGSVMFDDVPREVFKHYMELEKIGLAAPQVTYIMKELRDHGMMVSDDVTTIDEAKNEIKRYFAQLAQNRKGW